MPGGVHCFYNSTLHLRPRPKSFHAQENARAAPNVKISPKKLDLTSTL